MKNKKNKIIGFVLITFILSTISVGCKKIVGIKGNGNVLTVERFVSDFDKISVGSAFDVVLVQDSIASLTIESDENLLDIIESTVVNGKLKIYTSNPILKATKLNATIHFIDINLLDFSGAVDAVILDTLKTDDIEIEISGATEIELALISDNADFEISGSSHMDIDLQTDMLSLDLSGASNIYISGETEDADYSISGASKYTGFGFVVNYMDITISGASQAFVNVIDTLVVDASGTSEVIYQGDPELFLNLTGASTVEPF